MEHSNLAISILVYACWSMIYCKVHTLPTPNTNAESPFSAFFQLLAARPEINETESEISFEETILDGHLKMQLKGTESEKEIIISKRSCLPYGALCANGYCCIEEGLECVTNSRGRGRNTNMCRYSG